MDHPQQGVQGQRGVGLCRETVKYIAIVAMTLNHIAHCFLTPGAFLYQLLVGIGYFTAPVMCYFLTEGYGYTRSKQRYALRLLLFALISQPPFWLAFSEKGVGANMIFTLFLCVCLLIYMEKMEGHPLCGLGLFALTAVTIFSDWGVAAPLMVYGFQKKKGDRKGTGGIFWLTALWMAVNEAACIMEQGGGPGQALAGGFLALSGPCLAGVVILFFYNGKKSSRGGRFSKWFFYLYYPAHLLALGLLCRCL